MKNSICLKIFEAVRTRLGLLYELRRQLVHSLFTAQTALVGLPVLGSDSLTRESFHLVDLGLTLTETNLGPRPFLQQTSITKVLSQKDFDGYCHKKTKKEWEIMGRRVG